MKPNASATEISKTVTNTQNIGILLRANGSRVPHQSYRTGQSARADKLALADWTMDRTGLPLLRDALAWFECQVVSEHPAGDHVLVLGKVIDGKLLDAEAEPMCYRETGAMDGASPLYPEVLGQS
jgi:flavin reductase (DIM6/NTAB) family NADH-FMN oxidoreductase RutF